MNKGFSFLEVLIVTAILAITLGAVFSLVYQSQQSFQSERQLNDTVQQARIAMDQIVRCIRQAGNDPRHSIGVPPVEVLGTGYIRINSDITGSVASTTGNSMESTGDPDGTLSSVNERVTVRHDAGEQRLYLDIGDGEELLADHISALNLSFFDAQGAATTDPAAIVRVDIEMVAETAKTRASTGNINSVTLTSTAFIRNRSYQLFSE